jgi:hypothetical protein
MDLQTCVVATRHKVADNELTLGNVSTWTHGTQTKETQQTPETLQEYSLMPTTNRQGSQCQVWLHKRADGAKWLSITMGAPREVATSDQAGRGNFTLHSIQKASVHVPVQ